MSHPELGGGPSSDLAVTGAVVTPLHLDVAALRALPPVTVSAQGHSDTGPTLWALLRTTVGIRGARAKNPTVSMYLVAGGTDGYNLVVALAEIDPDFGNRTAIVAYEMDDAPIGRSGALRLILPGDVKMGRSVSNLHSIDLVATR